MVKKIFGKSLDKTFNNFKRINIKSIKQLKVVPKRSVLDYCNINRLKVAKKFKYDTLTSVTFNNLDGTKKILPFNDMFFKNEKNVILKPHQVIEKLNTLKHDFIAQDFVINN